MDIVAARGRLIAVRRRLSAYSVQAVLLVSERPTAAFLGLLFFGLALRLLLAYVVFPQAGLRTDLHLFGDWSRTLAEVGPGGFYANVAFSDYPPGYLYVLWGYGLVGQTIANLLGGPSYGLLDYWIKLPALVADCLVAVVLYRALVRWQGPRAGLLVSGAYLLTPVTWYDSALWGQVDAFGVLLLALAMIWLIDWRPELATLAAVAAFVVKLQFGIGLAVVAVVLLRRHLLAARDPSGTSARQLGLPPPETWLDDRLGQGIMRLVSSALLGLAAFLLLLVPFDLETLAPAGLAGIPIIGDLAGFVGLSTSAGAFYPVLTANAYNPWALVGPTPLVTALSGNYQWTFDSLSLFGVPAVVVGAVLFLAVAAGVAVLLWRRPEPLAILVGITVLAVAFFVLPTRVHERYLFGAIGVGAMLFATSRGWRLWFVGLSAVGLINMHAILTLAFRGYGTPEMRALPFADLAREPLVIAFTALLSIAVLAWPIYCAVRLWRERPTEPPAAFHLPPPPPPPPPPWIAPTEPVERAGPAVEEPPWGVRDSAAVTGAPASPPARRFMPLDWLLIVSLIVLALLVRLPGLDRPLGMYFDEDLHVRTSAEFLQGYRYGMLHPILEWTHPPLSKYVMAASVDLFGGNRQTGTADYGVEVIDAVVEPARAADGGAAAQPSRLYLLIADGVLAVELGGAGRQLVPVTAGTHLALDDARATLLIGTDSGQVLSLSTAPLGAASPPQLAGVGQIEGPVAGLWSVGSGVLLASDGSRLTLFGDGVIAAQVDFEGASGAVALPSGDLAVSDSRAISVLNGQTLATVAVVVLPDFARPRGMVLVEGSDFESKARDALVAPILYVATDGGYVARIVDVDAANPSFQGRFFVPGDATDVAWNPSTNLLHVLGTRDGTPTVFVVEPHGEAVFADVPLSIEPIAWGLDVRREQPAVDHQQAIAVDATGHAASVALGGTNLAARLPGVALGALMVGLASALVLLLFRRRAMALLAGGLFLVDGLLFSQSRIATPDVYTGFFVVAAYTLFAVLLRRAEGDGLGWRGVLLGFAGVGLLLGLAALAKWNGIYAIGGVTLLALIAAPGWPRWLGVGLLIAGLGVLSLESLLGSPTDYLFPLIALVVSALAVALARRWTRATDAWHSAIGGRAIAAGLAVMLVAAAVVYVVGFLPQLALDPAHPGFIDQQVRMYRFHAESAQVHGAGTPWWSWPLELKPLWPYLESFGNSQAGIWMAANPLLLWLSAPALVFTALTLARRIRPGPLLIVVAFLVQWLPWAGIQRVAFQYHYYTALPFALIALAWLLWRLWQLPSPVTWLGARVALIIAASIPAVLWLGAGPICAGLNTTRSAAVCEPGWTLSVPLPALTWAVLLIVGGAAVGTWLVRRPAVLAPPSRREVGLVLGGGVGLLVIGVALAGWESVASGIIELNQPSMAAGAVLILACVIALTATVRSPRSYVIGACVAAGVMFALFYPVLAGLPTWPSLIYDYQALLPTSDVSFTFNNGTGPLVPLLAWIVAPLVLIAAVAWWGLRTLDRRRAALPEAVAAGEA
jgi:dolichyl-phosphate-mannose--protein O-mannosyl transferase